jgi:hypothetical protein
MPAEQSKFIALEQYLTARPGHVIDPTLMGSASRSVRISASSEALDRKSPMTAHQISL